MGATFFKVFYILSNPWKFLKTCTHCIPNDNILCVSRHDCTLWMSVRPTYVYIDCWSWPLWAAQKDDFKWHASFFPAVRNHQLLRERGSSCTLWRSLFYLSVSNSIPLLCLLIKVIQTPCASKGPWKIKQPISWQLFSLISWRQPMGMCLQWWRPGRDSCFGFCTFCNPNTYFALCSAQAKIKYRQTSETVSLLLIVRKRKEKKPTIFAIDILKPDKSMWLPFSWTIDCLKTSQMDMKTPCSCSKGVNRSLI